MRTYSFRSIQPIGHLPSVTKAMQRDDQLRARCPDGRTGSVQEARPTCFVLERGVPLWKLQLWCIPSRGPRTSTEFVSAPDPLGRPARCDLLLFGCMVRYGNGHTE